MAEHADKPVDLCATNVLDCAGTSASRFDANLSELRWIETSFHFKEDFDGR